MSNCSFILTYVCCFFFFSSRRRHTRYWRDWSSDVCSSDLDARHLWLWAYRQRGGRLRQSVRDDRMRLGARGFTRPRTSRRSEERRVGKEWRCRWGQGRRKKREGSRYHTERRRSEESLDSSN